MKDSIRIEHRFLAITQRKVKRNGMAIHPSYMHRLRDFIKHGVEVLTKELKAEGSRHGIKLKARAEDNMLVFVTLMLEEARRRHLHYLELSIHKKVTRKICPLWPFC